MTHSAKVWALRALAVAGIVALCEVVDSNAPAVAFALAWGPNGLFLGAFVAGVLRLPRFLEPVHPLEPKLYRWLGVGLVKRLVTNPLWPMVVGVAPPEPPKQRHEFLDRTELVTKGAEVCHGATFVLGLGAALYCSIVDWTFAATWILAFNVALNAYPVMLQRSNRWRIRKISRAGARIDDPLGAAR